MVHSTSHTVSRHQPAGWIIGEWIFLNWIEVYLERKARERNCIVFGEMFRSFVGINERFVSSWVGALWIDWLIFQNTQDGVSII